MCSTDFELEAEKLWFFFFNIQGKTKQFIFQYNSSHQIIELERVGYWVPQSLFYIFQMVIRHLFPINIYSYDIYSMNIYS